MSDNKKVNLNVQEFPVRLKASVVFEHNATLVMDKFPFTGVKVVAIVKDGEDYKFTCQVQVKS